MDDRSQAAGLRVAAAIALLSVALTWGSGADAAALPSDICALLPANQIGKVVGLPFGAPQRSPAPKVYKNTNMGTRCDYQSTSGSAGVRFTVYVEPSAAVARDTFDKVRAFFGAGGKFTTVTGIGDEAYRDTGSALHVLKGAVHYAIDVSPPSGTAQPQQDQEVSDLAKWVAAQL